LIFITQTFSTSNAAGISDCQLPIDTVSSTTSGNTMIDSKWVPATLLKENEKTLHCDITENETY
jgi:hypothetical protein